MVNLAGIAQYLGYNYLPDRYQKKFGDWLAAIDAGILPASDAKTLQDEFVSTSATFGVRFDKSKLPNLVPIEILQLTTGPAAPVPAGWIQAGPGRWTAPTQNPQAPQQVATVSPSLNNPVVSAPIASSGEGSDWISPPPPTQPAPAPIVAPTTAPPAPAVPTPKPAQPAPQVTAPPVAARMATQTEPDMAIAQTPNGQTFQVAPSPGGGPTASLGLGSILAGAAAGFLTGGPVGALVGGALGAGGGGTAQVGGGPVISTTLPQYPQYPQSGPAMPGFGPNYGATPGIAGGQQTAGWGNPIDRQLAEILAGGLPGPLGMGAQWGIDQFYGDTGTSLPQPSVVQAGMGAAIVEPLAKTINKAPAGYVLVTRDWLNNGTQTTLAVRKDMARCYGYKRPAKPPISVGDWNALKKANRTVKKVQRIDKMAANLTKCSTRRRTR